MRAETSLTTPLLRRPPRTPAAFNGQIRDKRERKQEMHPSANEIFAVHYRGKRKWRTETDNKDMRPSRVSPHYWDYTASSVRSTLDTNAKSTVVFKLYIGNKKNTWVWGQTGWSFWNFSEAVFFYALTSFTQEWIRRKLIAHLNANELRSLQYRSERSEVQTLSPRSSARAFIHMFLITLTSDNSL